MSGGAIAVVPGLLFAPVAAVAAGAGLAAALAIRAAQAGTEAAGRALEEFADELERQGRVQDEREVRARLWELAAGAVVRTNQELRLLAGRAAQAGAPVRLPEPLDLTGHGLADARDWVEATQQTLAGARAAVERAEADREQRLLLAQLPAPADDTLSAAELLSRVARALAGRPRRLPGQRPPVPAMVDRDRVTAVIEQTVARLHLDATAAERELVVRAAARAAAQRAPGMSRTFVEALAGQVERINARAEARADAAGWLDALEHPLVAEAIAEITPPLPPHLSDRLRAVVRGDADLTDQDREYTREALARAQQQIGCRRLLEVMDETLTGLGFAVTTGVAADGTTKLCVARDSWHGAHRADVVVDRAGRVRYRMVEQVPDAPAEVARCEDLNQSMQVVGQALAGRGLEAEVYVPVTLQKPLKDHSGHPVDEQFWLREAEPEPRAIDPRKER